MATLKREAKAGRQLWKEFREEPVRAARMVRVEWPKALMVMGEVELIAYRTTHNGKLSKYDHQFHPAGRPLLCAGKKPGQLFIIGQQFKVNARGIVDIDRDGRRRPHTPTLRVVKVR